MEPIVAEALKVKRELKAIEVCSLARKMAELKRQRDIAEHELLDLDQTIRWVECNEKAIIIGS